MISSFKRFWKTYFAYFIFCTSTLAAAEVMLYLDENETHEYYKDVYHNAITLHLPKGVGMNGLFLKEALDIWCKAHFVPPIALQDFEAFRRKNKRKKINFSPSEEESPLEKGKLWLYYHKNFKRVEATIRALEEEIVFQNKEALLHCKVPFKNKSVSIYTKFNRGSFQQSHLLHIIANNLSAAKLEAIKEEACLPPYLLIPSHWLHYDNPNQFTSTLFHSRGQPEFALAFQPVITIASMDSEDQDIHYPLKTMKPSTWQDYLDALPQDLQKRYHEGSWRPLVRQKGDFPNADISKRFTFFDPKKQKLEDYLYGTQLHLFEADYQYVIHFAPSAKDFGFPREELIYFEMRGDKHSIIPRYRKELIDGILRQNKNPKKKKFDKTKMHLLALDGTLKEVESDFNFAKQSHRELLFGYGSLVRIYFYQGDTDPLTCFLPDGLGPNLIHLQKELQTLGKAYGLPPLLLTDLRYKPKNGMQLERLTQAAILDDHAESIDLVHKNFTTTLSLTLNHYKNKFLFTNERLYLPYQSSDNINSLGIEKYEKLYECLYGEPIAALNENEPAQEFFNVQNKFIAYQIIKLLSPHQKEEIKNQQMHSPYLLTPSALLAVEDIRLLKQGLIGIPNMNVYYAHNPITTLVTLGKNKKERHYALPFTKAPTTWKDHLAALPPSLQVGYQQGNWSPLVMEAQKMTPFNPQEQRLENFRCGKQVHFFLPTKQLIVHLLPSAQEGNYPQKSIVISQGVELQELPKNPKELATYIANLKDENGGKYYPNPSNLILFEDQKATLETPHKPFKYDENTHSKSLFMHCALKVKVFSYVGDKRPITLFVSDNKKNYTQSVENAFAHWRKKNYVSLPIALKFFQTKNGDHLEPKQWNQIKDKNGIHYGLERIFYNFAKSPKSTLEIYPLNYKKKSTMTLHVIDENLSPFKEDAGPLLPKKTIKISYTNPKESYSSGSSAALLGMVLHQTSKHLTPQVKKKIEQGKLSCPYVFIPQKELLRSNLYDDIHASSIEKVGQLTLAFKPYLSLALLHSKNLYNQYNVIDTVHIPLKKINPTTWEDFFEVLPEAYQKRTLYLRIFMDNFEAFDPNKHKLKDFLYFGGSQTIFYLFPEIKVQYTPFLKEKNEISSLSLVFYNQFKFSEKSQISQSEIKKRLQSKFSQLLPCEGMIHLFEDPALKKYFSFADHSLFFKLSTSMKMLYLDYSLLISCFFTDHAPFTLTLLGNIGGENKLFALQEALDQWSQKNNFKKMNAETLFKRDNKSLHFSSLKGISKNYLGALSICDRGMKNTLNREVWQYRQYKTEEEEMDIHVEALEKEKPFKGDKNSLILHASCSKLKEKQVVNTPMGRITFQHYIAKDTVYKEGGLQKMIISQTKDKIISYDSRYFNSANYVMDPKCLFLLNTIALKKAIPITTLDTNLKIKINYNYKRLLILTNRISGHATYIPFNLNDGFTGFSSRKDRWEEYLSRMPQAYKNHTLFLVVDKKFIQFNPKFDIEQHILDGKIYFFLYPNLSIRALSFHNQTLSTFTLEELQVRTIKELKAKILNHDQFKSLKIKPEWIRVYKNEEDANPLPDHSLIPYEETLHQELCIRYPLEVRIFSKEEKDYEKLFLQNGLIADINRLKEKKELVLAAHKEPLSIDFADLYIRKKVGNYNCYLQLATSDLAQIKPLGNLNLYVKPWLKKHQKFALFETDGTKELFYKQPNYPTLSITFIDPEQEAPQQFNGIKDFFFFDDNSLKQKLKALLNSQAYEKDAFFHFLNLDELLKEGNVHKSAQPQSHFILKEDVQIRATYGKLFTIFEPFQSLQEEKKKAKIALPHYVTTQQEVNDALKAKYKEDTLYYKALPTQEIYLPLPERINAQPEKKISKLYYYKNQPSFLTLKGNQDEITIPIGPLQSAKLEELHVETTIMNVLNTHEDEDEKKYWQKKKAEGASIFLEDKEGNWILDPKDRSIFDLPPTVPYTVGFPISLQKENNGGANHTEKKILQRESLDRPTLKDLIPLQKNAYYVFYYMENHKKVPLDLKKPLPLAQSLKGTTLYYRQLENLETNPQWVNLPQLPPIYDANLEVATFQKTTLLKKEKNSAELKPMVSCINNKAMTSTYEIYNTIPQDKHESDYYLFYKNSKGKYEYLDQFSYKSQAIPTQLEYRDYDDEVKNNTAQIKVTIHLPKGYALWEKILHAFFWGIPGIINHDKSTQFSFQFPTFVKKGNKLESDVFNRLQNDPRIPSQRIQDGGTTLIVKTEGTEVAPYLPSLQDNIDNIKSLRIKSYIENLKDTQNKKVEEVNLYNFDEIQDGADIYFLPTYEQENENLQWKPLISLLIWLPLISSLFLYLYPWKALFKAASPKKENILKSSPKKEKETPQKVIPKPLPKKETPPEEKKEPPKKKISPLQKMEKILSYFFLPLKKFGGTHNKSPLAS